MGRDFPGGLQGPVLGPIPNDKMVQFFPKKVEFIPNGKKYPILVVCKHLFCYDLSYFALNINKIASQSDSFRR